MRQRLRRAKAKHPARSRISFDQRLEPVQRDPFARGLPIDRYYIDRFLARWNDASVGDIRGSVLEFYDTRYASAVGGWPDSAGRVTHVDVIDILDNPRATIRADIANAPELPDATYDSVICTQVLQYVQRPDRAVTTLRRLLRPGGVLYVTVPGLWPNRGCIEGGGIEQWRFTVAGAEAIVAAAFREGDVVVQTFGNVLTAVGTLHGLASEEFTPEELDYHDPAFEVIIAIRAQAPAG
jgi:SAM-dependent methyltransferase